MKISIKNPAPLGPDLQKWGDYHFGVALAQALEKQGATVVQHFWPEWDKDDGEDLVIVLRGKRSHVPPPSKLSLIWVISHPGTVKFAELAPFDMVFVASETHYQSIANVGGLKVDIARQCTDSRAFFADGGDNLRRGISFVANSRGIRREMLSWAIEAGAPIDLLGRHWQALDLGHLVKAQYVDNAKLPDFYRKTRLALNDHWSDMAHFGYINNRIFDCLACGTPVLTDHFPELQSICGDGVLYARDVTSFRKAMQDYVLGYPDMLGRAQALWERIGANYSFEARAAQIWDWANTILSIRKSLCHDDDRPATAADVAHLEAGVREAVNHLRTQGVTRSLTTLHLCPSPQGTSALFLVKEITYLSAGFGRGPWHVLMDEKMSMVADGHFDMIVIEPSDNFERLPAQDKNMLIRRLQSKLSRNGVLVAPDAQLSGSDEWYLLSKAGMEPHLFAIFVPQDAGPENAVSAPSSPSNPSPLALQSGR